MSQTQDFALSGLLHDLNNVLQTLVDAADQLAQDPRWEPLSAAILRSVERGRRISLSLQSGAARGVAFEKILANAVAFVEDSLLAAGGPEICFACQVEPGIELAGNWAWERVLINLFLNSMRAMPEGGIIQVDARRAAGEVLIVVRDSGTGIEPRVLENLFEPYASTRSGGGLGLHVVDNIVRQDGGTVCAVNRTDGPGAEFTIRLPQSCGAGASACR